MNHATNCKFCRQPIVIQVDDDYAALGDPNNLLRLATCNRCADQRTRRRALEESIKAVCLTVQFATAKGQAAAVATARPLLEALTRKYAVLVADWHNMSGYLWDEEFVNLLIEKPDKLWAILNNYWRTFRQSQIR
jgi:hypothetical protein